MREEAAFCMGDFVEADSGDRGYVVDVMSDPFAHGQLVTVRFAKLPRKGTKAIAIFHSRRLVRVSLPPRTGL